MENTDRYALITGASAGIGSEFARQLAAIGYHLVLTARRTDRLQQLADELTEQYGINCVVIPADLADPAASQDLYNQIEQQGLQIEFLVNNAGYGLPGHFTQPDWAGHRDFIQVMMTAVCELTYRLLPAMQQRGRGYIINVASLAGLIPGSAGHTLYGASKAFLIRFSESLAFESRQQGIHVSALCPGFTYSEFHDVTGTRELVSKMPGYMWMEAQEVVAYGIDSVRRSAPRITAIPGVWNKFIATLLKILPRPLAYRFVQAQSKRFRTQYD